MTLKNEDTPIVAYKGFAKNWTCRGYQYSIGYRRLWRSIGYRRLWRSIGMINERLGFVVNAEFLAQLGFEPKQVGKYKKYHEQDFLEMCARIVRHVYDVQQGFVKAA